MFVTGLPLRDEAILEVARLVDDPDLASKLEAKLQLRNQSARPDDPREVEASGRLEDPPADLAELRGVLRELAWLRSEGLV